MASSDLRLIEIMADLLAEVHLMRTDNNERLDRLEKNVGEINKQMAKNNLAIGELRLSVMSLADRIEELFQLEKRVRRIEAHVFPDEPDFRKAA